MKYENAREVVHRAVWLVAVTAMCHTPARNAWNSIRRVVWVCLGFWLWPFLTPTTSIGMLFQSPSILVIENTILFSKDVPVPFINVLFGTKENNNVN